MSRLKPTTTRVLQPRGVFEYDVWCWRRGLQVLHTDFPSSLRREKSALQQRPHTLVVIVFNPVLFGCGSIHSTSPYSCDGVFFFVLFFVHVFFLFFVVVFLDTLAQDIFQPNLVIACHFEDVSHFRVLVVSGFLHAYLFEYDDFTMHGNHNPHNARVGALLIHRPA